MKPIKSFVALLIIHSTSNCLGFIQPSSRSLPFLSTQTSSLSSTSSVLFAQEKKRRRRKDSSSGNKSNSESGDPTSPNIINEEDDELPDFDLFEDEINESSSLSSSSKTSSNSNSNKVQQMKIQDIDPNDPNVLAAMQAVKGSEALGGASSSTKDLLRNRNRELEQRLVVDEITQDVPSLADYTKNKSSASAVGGGGKGRKALRREQAIAAAEEAERQRMEEENGIFSKLPFVGTGGNSNEEKEEKSVIKLLEEGTWACIFILVAWEIYINSPLFQRAAPMAPVVFQDPITTTFLL